MGTVALRVGNAIAQGPPIGLAWRLVENRTENRFRSELTLTNRGAATLAGDWAIFFNSAAKLYADSVSPGFALTHVNGDFYALRPKAGSPPIVPGESRVIALEGGPWAIMKCDAPSGCYFVANEAAGSTPIPVTLEIAPFPEAHLLKRGADDAVPVVTAESRFLANESLTLLPAESLAKVVPTPVAVEALLGRVAIKPTTVVAFDDDRLTATANMLADELAPLLGARPNVKQGDASQANAVRLRIADVEVDGSTRRAGDEAYTLTASSEGGIEIVGSDPAGVFYGTQTLRTLLPIEAYRTPADELVIDAVRIADAPRFRYRGVLLDVARNFQSPHTVKKLLDLMAFYKLNRLHWHLTDDEGWRIEIRALPELTEVGGRRGHTLDDGEHLVPSHGSGPFPLPAGEGGSGFYTQDDVIEILRHAAARQIMVIPEIDLPGHARAAIKAMEARSRKLFENGETVAADDYLLREPGDPSQYESAQMWNDNVVDVGRNATYRFLSVVIDELASVYRRAGVPLTCIHLGGDEVPSGAWEQSPACATIPVDVKSKIPRRGQLELYFLNRAREILARHSIRAACWEDCLLHEVDTDSAAGDKRRAVSQSPPTAYVWNNVWGAGREDAAYRLANAGFDVVLCNATHLYFDLACEKHPQELGHHWAGFVGTRAAFELVPLNVFTNVDKNCMGQPVDEASLAGRTRLTAKGARHILGIQGQLWAENLRSARDLEYMAFPRLVALAERAWARSPAWADVADAAEHQRQVDSDWNQFANRLGQRELPRLDFLQGGVDYRLPPPGAVVRDGVVHVKSELPGLVIRYTTDGREPTADDANFQSPLPLESEICLRTFDTRGRGSRTVTIEPPIHRPQERLL
jgi:hexosaminidase